MMMERTERRLARGNQLNAFNEEFDAIVERGVFRKLTDAEISRWSGPVHYTPLTEMYKKGDNVTTPLRICSNSAMMYKGKSLNSVLIKGGNSAPDLFAMLVKFRFYPVGLTRDCTKFYNCVFSSERDQHLRRVLWRHGDTSQAPSEYVQTTLAFGDGPAGDTAGVCLVKTAAKVEAEYPAAAEAVKNPFVDDIITGSSSRAAAEQLSMDIDKVLESGGFAAKPPHITGQSGTQGVLGLVWDKESDLLFVPVRVNPSGRTRGLHEQPDIPLDRVGSDFPAKLTKRQLWRIVQGQYDPLGWLSPYTIRFKLLLREVSV